MYVTGKGQQLHDTYMMMMMMMTTTTLCSPVLQKMSEEYLR
jgi:hypothetical protein